MERIIGVTIKDKVASCSGARYVCGNSDYVIHFDFDDEWTEFETKTARFKCKKGYVDVVFSGDVCAVPVITDVDLFSVGVYAGNIHTTTPAYVRAYKSILSGDTGPYDPPDDVYHQIMDMLNHLKEPAAVLYTSQSLTDEQQAQARANIGAGTPYTLPQASSAEIGGVKADAAEATDTQPVRIGEDGKLYTAPGGGTSDHNALRNRELSDQHPIASITGLDNALARKQDDPYADYTLLTGTAESPLDFDTITTPGFYKFTIDDDADSNFVNFPDMLWGFCTMEVWKSGYLDTGTNTWIGELNQGASQKDKIFQSRIKPDGGNWGEWDYSAPIYNDIPANSFELGGIMADPAESGDTQPVRIGEDSKLYTAPGGGTVWDELITLSEAVNEWSIDVPKGITDVKLRIVMPAVEANMTYGYILTNGAQSNFVAINWGDTSGEKISGVSWLVFKNGTIGQILAGNGAYWNSLDSFKNAVKDVTSLTSIGIKAYGTQTFPVGTTISVRGRS